MDKNIIKKVFPLLTQTELLEEISEHAIIRNFQEGEVIMRKGQYMKYIPLILNGSIKVMREDSNGKELLLYFLEQGNSCAMSITCCFHNEKSKIEAIAEEESLVLLVPLELSERLMKKYDSWRNFILISYSSRMEELLGTIDSIAFDSLDKRLLKYLHQKSEAKQSVEFSITHSEIARELNSSREATSRLLKKLESMGELELGRNRIKLLM